LKDSLSRGAAFEELVRTKGWEYITAWFQNQVQHFATELLIDDKKDMKEFDGKRRELMGVRKLIGMINGDIKTLQDHNEKARKSTKK